jgi:hypothetical protein
MRPMIHVQPTPELRRAFAKWATAQRPKVRTVSTTAFAVPTDLFASAPEEVLIGALVDGHRYVSPVEDEAEGRAAPGAARVGDQGQETVVPLAGTADAEGQRSQLPAAAEETGASGGQEPQPEGVFPCPRCDKELTTARGRDMHARKVHGTGVEGE